MEHLHQDAQIVDRLGGSAVLARLCGVRSQAVSQWKRHGIPAARRQFLQVKFPAAFEAEQAAEEQTGECRETA